ncbi:MAG: hypothetical protein IT548_04945 [Alphaproteobacteria bacterium]|nr:hypothetical protein [Alphaproteobacteria bacterium]
MKWVGRIAGIVGGLIAIGFGLLAIFGEAVLPKCDDTETKGVMGEIMSQRAAAMPVKMTADEIKSGLQVGDVSEASFDEAKQERTCKATLSLKSGETTVYDKLKVAYTIKWQDRKAKTFLVEMRAE